jgi:MFS family permease
VTGVRRSLEKQLPKPSSNQWDARAFLPRSMDPTSPTSTQSGPTMQRAGSALALLLAINLFNYIDRYILAAVEPLIAEHYFAATDETAMAKTGALATAFLVSYMLLAPGLWLARGSFSRAGSSSLVEVAVWSLASGWSGMATTFGMLLLTRVFCGCRRGRIWAGAPTIISDLYSLEKRGQMLSYFYVAIPVGSALGYALGGGVAQHYGWRWPFYIVVVPGLLLATVCLLMRDPRGSPGRVVAKREPLKFSDVLSLFRIKSTC